MKKNILIVGSDGQDGKILTKKLEQEGCLVTKISRLKLDGEFYFNIADLNSVAELLLSKSFDEIYFFAAHQGSSEISLPSSYDDYFITNHRSPLNFIESIRMFSRNTKFFFANSSHIYGISDGTPLNEMSTKNPVSLYGLSKLHTFLDINFYRDQFGLYLVNGILFNHESCFRKDSFLIIKIIKSAIRIKKQGGGQLTVGDLHQKVDWGYAPDYVNAMIKCLSLPKPTDYVISSGKLHTVQELIETIFNFFDLDWRRHIIIDKNLLKNNNHGTLFGNHDKLTTLTGWKPEYDFEHWVSKICSEIAD